MSRRKKPGRKRRPGSAAEWPQTPGNDGHVWSLGPGEADREWAAANLNGEAWHDQDAIVPDEVRADESAANDCL